MEEDVYKTIDEPAEGLYKEKGSKFISFVYPVKTEEEIKTILSDLKEKFYDARHHCYAWMLGAEKTRFRANDDGEPSSTAGKPILGQILSQDLTDVLVVVVRYFGGTKLGVSGLIQAYREAAADALAHAVVVEKTVNRLLTFDFSYPVMNEVMRVIKEENADILSREFEIACSVTLSIREKNAERLISRMSKVEGVLLKK